MSLHDNLVPYPQISEESTNLLYLSPRPF
jgi:hypothetical protein